jgi:2-oxoglutarate dehydrogenase complex dehydrogenase (E1) component-like enzyme
MAEIGTALTRVPDGFDMHKTVGRLLDAKKKMFETGKGFDWATAEALAFGSLAGRGLPGAPVGSGLHPRHLQPAPFRLCRSDRPKNATTR